MKLVLRLDVGRWSGILRACNNCQESGFDPMLKGKLLDHSPDFKLNFIRFYLNRFNFYKRSSPLGIIALFHCGLSHEILL